MPAAAPLAHRIGRIQAIIEGAGAPEVLPRPARAEGHALTLQRAARARRAASDRPPDEPWDVLTPADLAEHDLIGGPEPPWRGAG